MRFVVRSQVTNFGTNREVKKQTMINTMIVNFVFVVVTLASCLVLVRFVKWLHQRISYHKLVDRRLEAFCKIERSNSHEPKREDKP